MPLPSLPLPVTVAPGDPGHATLHNNVNSVGNYLVSDLQAQNTVLAAPSGSTGAAVFRLLTAADIPALGLSTATANTLMLRDANANVQINSLEQNVKRTNTNTTTLTLTAASAYYQNMFGSVATTFTLNLPDATTLHIGHAFWVQNDTQIATVTVNDGSGALLLTLAPLQSSILIYFQSTGGSDGVWEFTNVTGAGARVLAQSPVLTFKDAGTNLVGTAAFFGHNSTGTPAAGFGAALTMLLQSSTTTNRNAAEIDAVWNVATDASRVGDLVLQAYNVANAREGLRIRGGSSAAQLGFFGATPVSEQTDGAALTNSVTVGGTTNTIADFTNLTVYATDAPTIRNDIYQLARKLKIVDDALRAYGLLT